MTEPHYTSLTQPELNVLEDMIEKNGFAPVIAAIGDIVTQSSPPTTPPEPEFSFLLGQLMALAQRVDRA